MPGMILGAETSARNGLRNDRLGGLDLSCRNIHYDRSLGCLHAPPVADEPKNRQDEEERHGHRIIQKAQEGDDIWQEIQGRDSISNGAKERGEGSPREAGLDQRRASIAHIVSDRSRSLGVSKSPSGPNQRTLHPLIT